jgi:hypothetical protein
MISRTRACLFTLLLAAVMLFVAVASADSRHFNRTCSVTGGSAQRLSTVLSTCGHTGTVNATELTIQNSAAANLYVGQSDVDATNGYVLEPGTSSTRRSSNPADPIDTSQIYLFVAVTQNAGFSVRTR